MSTESFSSLIQIMTVLFFLLATGFFARKTGIIDEVASKRLSKLIVHIGQPMMIVYSLIKIEYSPENTRAGFTMFALGIGVHLLLCVMAFLLLKPLRILTNTKLRSFL